MTGEVARQFALNVRSELQGMSRREAAARCGVDLTTIFSTVYGKSWPESKTIAQSEIGQRRLAVEHITVHQTDSSPRRRDLRPAGRREVTAPGS